MNQKQIYEYYYSKFKSEENKLKVITYEVSRIEEDYIYYYKKDINNNKVEVSVKESDLDKLSYEYIPYSSLNSGEEIPHYLTLNKNEESLNNFISIVNKILDEEIEIKRKKFEKSIKKINYFKKELKKENLIEIAINSI